MKRGRKTRFKRFLIGREYSYPNRSIEWVVSPPSLTPEEATVSSFMLRSTGIEITNRITNINNLDILVTLTTKYKDANGYNYFYDYQYQVKDL